MRHRARPHGREPSAERSPSRAGHTGRLEQVPTPRARRTTALRTLRKPLSFPSDGRPAAEPSVCLGGVSTFTALGSESRGRGRGGRLLGGRGGGARSPYHREGHEANSHRPQPPGRAAGSPPLQVPEGRALPAGSTLSPPGAPPLRAPAPHVPPPRAPTPRPSRPGAPPLMPRSPAPSRPGPATSRLACSPPQRREWSPPPQACADGRGPPEATPAGWDSRAHICLRHGCLPPARLRLASGERRTAAGDSQVGKGG